MKDLLREISVPDGTEKFGIVCDTQGIELEFFRSVDDIVRSKMVDQIFHEIIKKTTENSFDLNRITTIRPKPTDLNSIMSIAKTFRTDIVFVGSKFYSQLKEFMVKTLSVDFKEDWIGSTSYVTLIVGGHKIRVYCHILFGWEYDHIHYLEPIKLDKKIEEYLQFAQNGHKHELMVESIRIPNSYKVRIA